MKWLGLVLVVALVMAAGVLYLTLRSQPGGPTADAISQQMHDREGCHAERDQVDISNFDLRPGLTKAANGVLRIGCSDPVSPVSYLWNFNSHASLSKAIAKEGSNHPGICVLDHEAFLTGGFFGDKEVCDELGGESPPRTSVDLPHP